jgi:type II secretory pathway component PulM
MNAYARIALEWWNARSRRERVLSWLLAAIVAALLAWYGLVTPLRLAAKRAETDHALAAQSLAAAQAAVRLAKHSQEAYAQTGATAVETIIAQSARDAGLAVSGIETSEPSRVTVLLTSAASPAFFGWIETLHRDYGIFPEDIAITRSASGLLDVHIAFVRSGQ